MHWNNVDKRFPISLLLSFWLTSCASKQEQNSAGAPTLSQSQYEDVIERHTERAETYSGLHNVIQAQATLLRTPVLEAQLKQMSRLYEWDSEKFSQERQKKFENKNSNTEVFLSFYTPEKKHDDLHKNQTLWKIFLDVGGRRQEGTAKKIKLLTNEVQGLYPFHNRFATAYILSFPVSLDTADNQSAKLTITGTPGSAQMNFTQ